MQVERIPRNNVAITWPKERWENIAARFRQVAYEYRTSESGGLATCSGRYEAEALAQYVTQELAKNKTRIILSNNQIDTLLVEYRLPRAMYEELSNILENA